MIFAVIETSQCPTHTKLFPVAVEQRCDWSIFNTQTFKLDDTYFEKLVLLTGSEQFVNNQHISAPLRNSRH